MIIKNGWRVGEGGKEGERMKVKLAVLRPTECYGGGLVFIPPKFVNKFLSDEHYCKYDLLGVFEFDLRFVRKLTKFYINGYYYYDETYIE